MYQSLIFDILSKHKRKNLRMNQKSVNPFLQQPLQYCQSNPYPKRSPYIQQNFKNFSKGSIISTLPIPNNLQIHQKIFYQNHNSLNIQKQSYPIFNNKQMHSNSQYSPQYLLTQIPESQVAHQSDRCFCCLGSIKQSQFYFNSHQKQFENVAKQQIRGGQQLLIAHQKFLINLQKERQLQNRQQNRIQQYSNNQNNRQQQISLTQYFKVKPKKEEPQYIDQQIQTCGFKCSECYNRICRKCTRKCQQCNKIICKFDFEDEDFIDKHKCYY